MAIIRLMLLFKQFKVTVLDSSIYFKIWQGREKKSIIAYKESKNVSLVHPCKVLCQKRWRYY